MRRRGLVISAENAVRQQGKTSSADRNAPCCVRSPGSTMPTFRAEKTYISGGACIAVEKHAILPKRRVGGSDRRNKRRIQEGPMGLFSNNKKLCPICGSPTPRLLPTKVEDMPLCKECAGKVDLPDGVLERMSLDQFKKYITYYDENQALRDAFKETDRMSFGFLSGELLADTEHRLLRLKGYDGALVFPASALVSFRFLEDGKTLFEGRADGLHCHQSDVPERARAMQMRVDRFQMQKEEYERMERMERMRDRDRRPGEPDDRRFDIPEPRFEADAPVHKFSVEVILSDPYWKSFRNEISAPSFSSTNPSIIDYLNEYDEKVEELHRMATALAHVMNPGARELWDGETAAAPAAQAAQPVQAAAPVVDTVAELQKYKMLVDTGVITEEEFAAKKKQLLGI